MLSILSEETDPYFNLSAEEFLLKNYEEDIFMLWRSHDTVVVGKHQIALAEINYRYIREKGIRLARRISGGGTVFHDSGNINFSFIRSFSSPQDIGFGYFTGPVIAALKDLGLDAGTSGRNDLLIQGKKISGNAEHIYKNRVLHHGTLLFDSGLKNLGNALHIVPGKYLGKAVVSNRSDVGNISEFLAFPMTIESFIRHVIGFLKTIFPDMKEFQIPETDKEKIRLLSLQKFASPEWQFGYSPGYLFINTSEFKNRLLSVELIVEKGIIKKTRLAGNFYSGVEIKMLEALLTDKYHVYETIDSGHQILGLHADDDLNYCYF